MPIKCKFPVEALSQDEFHAIDRTVMKHAFDIQNEFGRLCDELIYKNTSSAESVGENTKPYTFKHYRKGFFLENRPDFSRYDIWINET